MAKQIKQEEAQFLYNTKDVVLSLSDFYESATPAEIIIKTKEMPKDKVLQALNNYLSQATEEQKKSDLDELEKECLSDVDAYQYVKDIEESENE